MVGIIGLEQAMNAMALVFAHRSDDDIGNEILKRVYEKNYIPSRAKELMQKPLFGNSGSFSGNRCRRQPLKVCVLLSSVPVRPVQPPGNGCPGCSI